ncbi:uncharacterized protein V6R79_020216 [Siganus canaliculatus]
MSRLRRRFGSSSPLTESPLQRPAGAFANLRSRSSRLTERTQAAAKTEPPTGPQPEFKTPTRVPRARAGVGFSQESPHNDSDFQQDIIWDATSPSPNRLGKRGKKHQTGVVDISEIVNRIAPKHGRPVAAEPTLQQWIGDSATIPCTPDVQVPKLKRSPKSSGVDDLLKLAKQFDLNMFHQIEEDEEEEEVKEEEPLQQSLELLPDDMLDLEEEPNNGSLLCPGNAQPAVTKPEAAVQQDTNMEDDLDFLFDGPTQYVSGNLSQASTQGKASGKHAASSHRSTFVLPVADAKAPAADCDFEDDWENDDFLNDSLVLEMTQHPQKFTTPKHSSTQKASSEIKHAPVCVGGISQSAASKVEKDNARQRRTFRLESNPGFSVKRVQRDTWTHSEQVSSSGPAGRDTQLCGFSSSKGSVQAGSQHSSNLVRPDSQKPQFQQNTSFGLHLHLSPKLSTTASVATQSSATRKPAPAPVSDLLEEDLDAFFSSDMVWDDPADDDLLCELCEDIENQIQTVETRPAGPTSNQTAVLQPVNMNPPANQRPFPPKPTPAAPPCASGRLAASSSGAGMFSSCITEAQTNTVTNAFRYTQAQKASGATSSAAYVQGVGRVQAMQQENRRRDHFTFKKPNNPVSTVTSEVAGKCSAAEIELKKQQAMERRRQRLQATQKLGAPT